MGECLGGAGYRVALVLVYDSPSEQTLRLSSLWLFLSPRCLGNVGREAARATLCEKQQQTFNRLEKEWVGMRGVVTQKWPFSPGWRPE